MKICILLFATVISLIRFFIPSEPITVAGSYQAFAHLFVGGLLGAWLANRQEQKFCLEIAVLLSIVEVFCFVMKKL